MKLLLAALAFASPLLAQTQPAAPLPDLRLNWNASGPASSTRCRDESIPDFIRVPHGGEGYPSRYCHALNLTSSTPGFSLGNSFPGSVSGWQLYSVQDLFLKVYGAGIKSSMNESVACFGVGDCNNTIAIETIGGRTAPSDEGTEASRISLTEAPYTYSGTIVSEGGIGARTIKTSCPPVSQTTPTRCDSQGVGRYLIEEGTVYSGAATALRNTDAVGGTYFPSALTVKPALPKEMLSTAAGVLTSPCLVDQTAANTGTECKFTVKVSSGIFKKNYLVSATGFFHNQSQLTDAEGTGDTQTLTMVAHHSIPAGAYIYQGREYGDPTPSCTGTALELLANTVEHFKYPVDVIGCNAGSTADSSVLQVAMFVTGRTAGLDLANVVLGTTRVSANLTSDANGTVTLSPDGDVPRYIGQTITIANSKYFSGPCTGVTYSNAGRTITCKEPTTGAHTDPSYDGVGLSLGTTGYGNSSLVLHRMAEVLDVRNPQTQAVDGSFVLEANEMANVKGTQVEESHYYSQQLGMHADGMAVFTPYHSEFHYGLGTTFFKGAYGPNFAGWHVSNASPLTGYAGFGGTRYAPDIIRTEGLWNSFLRMDHAPGPAGAALESVGCPLTDAACADTAYSWLPRKFEGNSGQFTERWSPATNSYLMQVSSRRGTSIFAMNPDGFSLNKPLEVVSGVSTNDAATIAQLPLAASFVSGNGTMDTVNVKGVTARSHCSVTATNAAAAGNITSTYISGKFEGRVAITHAAVAGMTYDLICTSY